jgi:hypothetical protein
VVDSVRAAFRVAERIAVPNIFGVLVAMNGSLYQNSKKSLKAASLQLAAWSHNYNHVQCIMPCGPRNSRCDDQAARFEAFAGGTEAPYLYGKGGKWWWD